MSYRIFLDSFLLPFKYNETADLEAVNNAIKARRQKMKRIFTEAGQPGDMFRHADTVNLNVSCCTIQIIACSGMHSLLGWFCSFEQH